MNLHTVSPPSVRGVANCTNAVLKLKLLIKEPECKNFVMFAKPRLFLGLIDSFVIALIDKKRVYDSYGVDGLKNKSGSGFNHNHFNNFNSSFYHPRDPFDIFKSFFGSFDTFNGFQSRPEMKMGFTRYFRF